MVYWCLVQSIETHTHTQHGSLVQKFEGIESNGQPIVNEYDLTLTELVSTLTSIVHQSYMNVTDSCEFVDDGQVERETNRLAYMHDWTNKLYCTMVEPKIKGFSYTIPLLSDHSYGISGAFDVGDHIKGFKKRARIPKARACIPATPRWSSCT